MNMLEYAKRAAATAIYAEKYTRIYPALGLIGEIGEFQRAFDELREVTVMRSDRLTLKLNIKKEAGDVLWYLVACCRDFAIPIKSVFQFTEWIQLENICVRRAPLIDFATEFAECTKKLLRDDDNIMTDERRVKIRGLLCEVLIELVTMLNTAGISIEAVARANIKKLEDRQDRNVLTGDGDDR